MSDVASVPERTVSRSEGPARRFKIAVVNSHPIQYFAPLYRRLAAESDIDLHVYFYSPQGAEVYLDPGFGSHIRWNVPLLEGYSHSFLPDLFGRTEVAGFSSLINPGIVAELYKRRFDAVWVHGHNSLTDILTIVAARTLGIPVLMRCETHLSLRRGRLKRLLRHPLMGFMYRRLCSACLPIGTRNRDFYMSLGVPAERLFHVPYVVDNTYFANAARQTRDRGGAARSDLGIRGDVPVILYASKMTRRKRPRDVLDAYSLVRGRGIPASLIFVGSGEEEERLKRRVEVAGIPDVHFYGFQNQAELPRFYGVADLLVLPSDNEPWGLVVNEAMASGLPVIASDQVGAAPDLVQEGVNGFTFRAGDVAGLAERLERVIGDEVLRSEMARHSGRIIADWDFDACVRGLRAALHQVAVPRTGLFSARQRAD